jgi:hypothetical protein
MSFSPRAAQACESTDTTREAFRRRRTSPHRLLGPGAIAADNVQFSLHSLSFRPRRILRPRLAMDGRDAQCPDCFWTLPHLQNQSGLVRTVMGQLTRRRFGTSTR